MILYCLIYLQSSYLALYKSKNLFMKLIGVYIAFRFLFGWIEDFNRFDISNIALWMVIAMGLRIKSIGNTVEVEVETLEELSEALQANPDRILLDNFTMEMLAKAVNMNVPKRCDLEASGGINLDNLIKIANTGVDFISVGAITKSVKAIDLSLLIREML